jgi:hypothetical protein
MCGFFLFFKCMEMVLHANHPEAVFDALHVVTDRVQDRPIGRADNII